MNELPINKTKDMWFMQDDIPLHSVMAVRIYLNNKFRHRRIWRGREFPWPARSADLNLLDLLFLETYLDTVLAQKINLRQE